MTIDFTSEGIAEFDRVLGEYMSKEFGSGWRTMCHQSAKVSALALKMLGPQFSVELQRVELVAMMEGAGRLVHIGWADDPAQIPGKIPAHFAVSIGSALYDPTFEQLRTAKTPLELPAEPFFYAEQFLTLAPLDREGFRWVGLRRAGGMLRVGYKTHDEKSSTLPREALMADSAAQAHALKIVALAKLTLARGSP